MKELAMLIAGVLLGIMGEFYIPTSQQFGQTSGCLNLKKLNMVLIPQAYLYDPAHNPKPRPLVLSHGYVPSYKYLLARLAGEADDMDAKKCNELVEMTLEKKP